MATGTAIVAIPAREDPVWRYSSEKIPHLTVLFLGDQSSNPRIGAITEFVQHIADNSLTRFGLSVDRRGTLGPENADVLFFHKDSALRDIGTARGYMLTNADILAAYNSTPQFDTWQPHLTMGFPDSPAKPDNRDFPGFGWVSFNQLALWTGEFEGPTFDLKSEEWDLMMSGLTSKVLTLAHHGVKGMKWGVRKNKNGVRVGKPTAHPDAILAKVSKEKVKKNSTDALSNDELRNLVNRMGLEKQFASLKEPSVARKSGKILGDVLLSVGKQQAGKALNDQASKRITRLLANAGG